MGKAVLIHLSSTNWANFFAWRVLGYADALAGYPNPAFNFFALSAPLYGFFVMGMLDEAAPFSLRAGGDFISRPY